MPYLKLSANEVDRRRDIDRCVPCGGVRACVWGIGVQLIEKGRQRGGGVRTWLAVLGFI